MKRIKLAGLITVTSILTSVMLVAVKDAWGLPPPEDLPEEVLRTEIITEAISPIDGRFLTAAEYAELQALLRRQPPPPSLDPKIQELIFLVRIRQLLRSIGVPIP